MIVSVDERRASVEAQAVPIQNQVQDQKQKSVEKIHSEQDLNVKSENYKTNGKNVKAEEEKVKFSELFRFATKADKTLILFGGACSLLNGLCLPAFVVIMGKLINGFGPDQTADDMVDSALTQFYYFLIIACASFFLSWTQMYTFMNTGEKQSIKFRIEYFKAILRQDISWFDEIDPNSLSMKIATESFAIQGAIGEKIPTFVQTLATCIGGFVVGFLYGWELALVCIAVIPFLGLAATMFTIIIQTAEAQVANTYTEAGGRAEQAMFGVKTVKSLNGQQHEQKRYLKSLMWAYKRAVKDGIKIGLALGFLFLFMIGINSVGFYAGSEFIRTERNNSIEDRPYNIGDVLTVFFAIMMGGMNIGQTTPCLEKFALGQSAAYKVLQVIDAKPKISPSLLKGEKIQNVKGEIKFNDVEFTYPTKQDVQVLKKINLTIQSGKKTALVGESGCGKSTCMQLVERFYDADKGSVTVDGINIKDLNLSWYRENVGYVGQEPVLFAGSIRENMRYGKPDATEEQMIEALKHARAWDFVNSMQDKLDTMVGNNGGQLSGGQKQRLCIARAILKSPPILLLDEATSALDRQNEKSIQKTLDEVSSGRTTLVIAHRLATIMNADEIIVIDQGKVIERGNHSELVALGGKYAALSKNQKKAEEDEEENMQNIEKDGFQNEDEEEQEEAIKEQQPALNWNKSAIHKAPKQNPSTMFASNLHKKDHQNLEISGKNQLQVEKTDTIKKGSIMLKLVKLNSDNWVSMVIGTIASCVVGAVQPISGLLMGKLLITLGKYGTIYYVEEEYKDDRDLYVILYLVLAICAAIGSVFQVAAWRKVGQGVTYKLRDKAFSKIMKMRPDWFDFPENSAGILSSKLGSDTQIVYGLASTVVNIQINNFSSLVVGIIIALYYEWRICLIAMCFVPFIIMAGKIQANFAQGFGDKTDAAYKNSGNLVQDSVVNMRTVNSFGNEKFIIETYEKRLEGPKAIIAEKALKTGVFYGASQFVMFVVMGIMFYIGSLLIRDYNIEVEGMYIGLFAIMNAAMATGNSNQFMVDLGQAFNAARSLFSIYDTQDEEQYNAEICPNPIKIENMQNFQGHIKFENVFFKYPTRNKYVLHGISFEILPGQKIAFVGPSGCGKSTVMQLLQRFYEIESGTITIDGRNLNEYDIFSLRAQYGVVSQEPILFNGTIRENIEYNTPNLTLNDVKHLAKLANASEFIEKDEGDLPQNLDLKEIGRGYDRQVGNKGGSLSGGQKQRVAIARAIAKNPKILFLDEATSALDNENEKKVQASLDKLMEGRTTLAVAHRIPTIADSDKIFVFENGYIVEEGNYNELVAKKNYFYRLERGEQK